MNVCLPGCVVVGVGLESVHLGNVVHLPHELDLLHRPTVNRKQEEMRETEGVISEPRYNHLAGGQPCHGQYAWLRMAARRATSKSL
jgi:hypothetical protein